MKLLGFSKPKTLVAHKYFAWRPVFAWDMTLEGNSNNKLGMVWLEYVWREPWTISDSYRNYRLDKNGNPKKEKL